MPITLKWYNEEKTIIYEQLIGDVSGADLSNALDGLTAMLNTVNHTVDILLVLRNSNAPTDVAAQMPDLVRKLDFWNHRNLGRSVVVGISGFLKVLLSVFTKVYPSQAQRYLSAATEEEALALLSISSAGSP